MDAPVDILARAETSWGRESPEYAALAELMAALDNLPADVDMVEDNPDEGSRYFCCGEPYQHEQYRHHSRPNPNKHAGGRWPCWYPRIVAAVAGVRGAA